MEKVPKTHCLKPTAEFDHHDPLCADVLASEAQNTIFSQIQRKQTVVLFTNNLLFASLHHQNKLFATFQCGEYRLWNDCHLVVFISSAVQLCWEPGAIIWGMLPTPHCCLCVNCSARCEWIFGKCPLMTVYVSPPALFTPRIPYWIYWLFFIGKRSRGQILWPVSLPERSLGRSNDTEGEEQRTKGLTSGQDLDHSYICSFLFAPQRHVPLARLCF